MKLIVGLGNPGRKYEDTRHNVGFMAAAKTAAILAASPSKTKFEGEIAEATAKGEKIVLLCPQTYMNASGQSVRKAADFYKLETSDILVICDDLNLPSGRLRIRPRGSAGGQNGLKDIIRHLGEETFARLRIGIDRPPDGWTVTDYVLGKFSKPEQETIELATTRAAHAAICWAESGVTEAMNQFNPDPDASKKEPKKRSVPPSNQDTQTSNQDTTENSKSRGY